MLIGGAGVVAGFGPEPLHTSGVANYLSRADDDDKFDAPAGLGLFMVNIIKYH